MLQSKHKYTVGLWEWWCTYHKDLFECGRTAPASAKVDLTLTWQPFNFNSTWTSSVCTCFLGFFQTPWHSRGSSMEWIPRWTPRSISSLWTILPSLLTAVHPASRQRILMRASNQPAERSTASDSSLLVPWRILNQSKILYYICRLWFWQEDVKYHWWTFYVRMFSIAIPISTTFERNESTRPKSLLHWLNPCSRMIYTWYNATTQVQITSAKFTNILESNEL